MITEVGSIIEVSLAPVFLLVGIGQMLNVVTNRLGRIIDRARWFEQKKNEGTLIQTKAVIKEINSLGRRMRLANFTVSFLTAAAMLICIDVVMLFTANLVAVKLDKYVLGLFIVSVASIIGGLLTLFMEVTLATKTLKFKSDSIFKTND